MVDRKEKLAITSLCISLIVIGIAIWRLQNVEVIPFKYSIENVRFNDKWFNFTIHFIELPKQGLTVYAIKIADVTQNFSPRQLATGDRITFDLPLGEPVSELPKNLKANLYTNEMGVVTIQITE